MALSGETSDMASSSSCVRQDMKLLCGFTHVMASKYIPCVFWYGASSPSDATETDNNDSDIMATLGPASFFSNKTCNPRAQESVQNHLLHAIFGNSPTRPLIFSNPSFRSDWFLATIPTKGFIAIDVLARSWFARVSSVYGAKWMKQMIYDFLYLSTYNDIPFDGSLSTALNSLWDPAVNCFLTSRGHMTVTLADIAYITGLSPTGLHIDHLSTENLLTKAAESTYEFLNRKFSNLTQHTNKCAFTKLPGFGNVVDHPQDADEALFIAFALTRMLMPKSGTVSNLFFVLACNISANNEELALAPLLLGCLFKCLFSFPETLLVDPSSLGIFGPIWLLTCWDFLYFPEAMVLLSDKDLIALKQKELNAVGAHLQRPGETLAQRLGKEERHCLLPSECLCYG